MFEYLEKIKTLIEKIETSQQAIIEEASVLLSETIVKDNIIHTFGTGHSHMIAMELFCRASGLANVNALLDDVVHSSSGARRGAEIERLSGLADVLWNKYEIKKEDVIIIISNSGRNAMPIEMAMRAKSEGIKTIAITSMEQSVKYASRHSSQKKLYEIADIVLDNCVPSGDGLMYIGNSLTGPASSIAGILLVNTLVTQAMKMALPLSPDLPVYSSQNIDNTNNDTLYNKYKYRIKHL